MVLEREDEILNTTETSLNDKQVISKNNCFIYTFIGSYMHVIIITQDIVQIKNIYCILCQK